MYHFQNIRTYRTLKQTPEGPPTLGLSGAPFNGCRDASTDLLLPPSSFHHPPPSATSSKRRLANQRTRSIGITRRTLRAAESALCITSIPLNFSSRFTTLPLVSAATCAYNVMRLSLRHSPSIHLSFSLSFSLLSLFPSVSSTLSFYFFILWTLTIRETRFALYYPTPTRLSLFPNLVKPPGTLSYLLKIAFLGRF